ncbi:MULTISPECIES: hypothetical protein [Thermodesulfovibrio]|uniref:hypothetical protein n=1 Tax=Thermodesulfovibrio TaxID=28261 RepID=UPI002622A784|nr:hypothetical protein [Thermodesulfovibrio sp.]
MPPIEEHVKISRERTGKDYRELHEWLDGDPEKKAERHDITKIYEYGEMIEERFGKEGLQEYIQHLHDDVKVKIGKILMDFERAMAEALSYFGIK